LLQNLTTSLSANRKPVFDCLHTPNVEGRLANLKTELKIAEVKMMQWNAFADPLRACGQKIARHYAMMKEHGGAMMSTVPEQLKMMKQHMTIHLDSLAL
jgi:hypothetical protein